MTLKEALLQALEDLAKPVHARTVYEHLKTKQYFPSLEHHGTPLSTIHAALGDFIRDADSRVTRYRPNKTSPYHYYLTKYADSIHLEIEVTTEEPQKTKEQYQERDLHPLLATYLTNKRIYPRTIFHERSKKKNDSNQKWIHPDVVGVRFTKLKNEATNRLLRTTDSSNAFELYSYELKRTLNNDYELKAAYFQALSNSAWANYGYLVAFEISNSLLAEMERLNQSFGIGVIQLSDYPYYSKVILPAQYRELDFRTIDKLAVVSEEFQTFIQHINRILKVDKDIEQPIFDAFKNYCDPPLKDDQAIEKHCVSKHIPQEEKKELRNT